MKKKQRVFVENLVSGIAHRLKTSVSDKRRRAGLSWLQEKRLKHLPYGRQGYFSLHEAKLAFANGPELLHSLEEIFVQDIYKINMSNPSPYIIDCGANIGLSVLYLKQQFPQATIVAFEPDPANFEYLQKNVAAYKLVNVELRNEAIWTQEGSMSFVSDGTLGSKLGNTLSQGGQVSVRTVRLKDYLSRPVDFLKMDIEGAEYEVLKDCADQLSMVTNLFIEYHGFFDKIHELTDLLQLIQGSGFVYYIKEAANVYPTPFFRDESHKVPYDIQQNIFCFRLP